MIFALKNFTNSANSVCIPFFRLAVKTGLAGGAVYYSREEGIWKENTDQVYERYSNALQPHLASVKQQIPVEVRSIFSAAEWLFGNTDERSDFSISVLGPSSSDHRWSVLSDQALLERRCQGYGLLYSPAAVLPGSVDQEGYRCDQEGNGSCAGRSNCLGGSTSGRGISRYEEVNMNSWWLSFVDLPVLIMGISFRQNKMY